MIWCTNEHSRQVSSIFDTQKNIRILNAMIVQLLSHLAVLIPLMFQFFNPKGQNINKLIFSNLQVLFIYKTRKNRIYNKKMFWYSYFFIYSTKNNFVLSAFFYCRWIFCIEASFLESMSIWCIWSVLRIRTLIMN